MERVANGEPTKSEALGHREFILTYKKERCAARPRLPAGMTASAARVAVVAERTGAIQEHRRRSAWVRAGDC